MKKTEAKHGLMVVDMASQHEDGTVPVVYIAVYKRKPTQVDELTLRLEIATNEELGLKDRYKDLDVLIASEDVLEFYNKITNEKTE
jgi:hypothetical protein